MILIVALLYGDAIGSGAWSLRTFTAYLASMVRRNLPLGPALRAFAKELPWWWLPKKREMLMLIADLVEDGMRTYASETDYKIDVRGKAIIIYTADQDFDTLVDHACSPVFQNSIEENERRMRLIRESIHYSDILKFILEDDKRRTFMTQRYCFLGSIDDWVYIGKPGTLPTLVKKYVKHIGKESYFELT